VKHTGYYWIILLSVCVSINAGDPEIEMRAFFFDEEDGCVRSAPSPVPPEEDVWVLEMEQQIKVDEETELLLKNIYARRIWKNKAYFGVQQPRLVIYSEEIARNKQSTCIGLLRGCPLLGCWYRLCGKFF
jgi:hypothetical protein